MKALRHMVVIGAMLTLTGCAWLQKVITTPSNTTVILQVAVEAAAGGVIEALPAASRASAAQAVQQGVTAMEAIDTDNQVSLAQLETQLTARLAKTSLSPAQQAQVALVVQAVVAIVAGKIQNGVLSSAQVTTLNTVLGWVVIGVQPYAT